MFSSRFSKVLYFFKVFREILYSLVIDSIESFIVTVWIWYLTYFSSSLILPKIIFSSIFEGVSVSSLVSGSNTSFWALVFSFRSIISASLLSKNLFNSASDSNNLIPSSAVKIYSTWTFNSSLLLNS